MGYLDKFDKYLKHNNISTKDTKQSTKDYLYNFVFDTTNDKNDVEQKASAIAATSSVVGGRGTTTTKVKKGGQSCDQLINKGLFKWTMQKYNENQKTLNTDLLKGGRYLLPSQYFGNQNQGAYTENVKFTTMSDINAQNVRPELLQSNSTGGGGECLECEKQNPLKLTMNDMKYFISNQEAGSMTKREQKELLNQYNRNIEQFVTNIKQMGGKITKKNISNSFKKLKLNY